MSETVAKTKASRFDILMDRFDIGGNLISNTSKELSSQEKLITVINQFEAFKKELAFFGLFFSLIQLIILFYTLFYQSTFKREYKFDFVVKLGLLLVAVPLSILGILATFGVLASAAPILTIISTTKSLLEKAWSVGVSIYERVTGAGKGEAKIIQNLTTDLKEQIRSEKTINLPQLLELTENINKQQDRHAKIANASHGLAVGIVAAVGSILLLTPAMPVGAAILAGVTAYSIMHALGYNPLKLLGRGINFLSSKIIGKPVINLDPFAHKTEMTVHDELQNEVRIEVKKEKPVAKNIIADSSPQEVRSTMAIVNARLQLSDNASTPNAPAITQEIDVFAEERKSTGISFFHHQDKFESESSHQDDGLEELLLTRLSSPAA